jgi:hypothetical protein
LWFRILPQFIPQNSHWQQPQGFYVCQAVEYL